MKCVIVPPFYPNLHVQVYIEQTGQSLSIVLIFDIIYIIIIYYIIEPLRKFSSVSSIDI